MAWLVGIGVFLFLLFAFPKPMGVLLLLLAIGVGAVVLFIWQDRKNAEDQRERITATASYGDSSTCADPNYPLSILFRNASGATVTDISFTISGFLPGFSNPRYTHYASWDRVMVPGMEYGVCWSINSYSLGDEDPSALRWSVRMGYADFE